MKPRKSLLTRYGIPILLLFVGLWAVWLPKTFQTTTSAAGSPHRVHIALGFHVNLYHSFRGDTNDENGFGQDIRMIRHIIETLDRFNGAGIPVRAVWDFDNLFSLQEILPSHAPDIIADVKRRVGQNRDDVILMSYNNGLVSAMDRQEFMTSMERAISNPAGSGIKDLFGRVTPVVRPQEMMTTPGNFDLYKKVGIPYVALYHSATPFDAFRLFSRALTPSEAHNPIRYENSRSGETIVVIPTYHVGDLVEHVSLRDWAETLHRYQVQGKIDRDVLIFVNFDADAEFWTGASIPWYLNWLPNTGGLGQLVESVADLDFVTFSNLSDYLKTHPPVGTVTFGQDTADGSFHGYHSWAEKADASDYWTRILQNRRMQKAVAQVLPARHGSHPAGEEVHELIQEAMETRLRALSTTNFGLAGPFLARPREAAMHRLLGRLDGYTNRLQQALVTHAAKQWATATPPDPASAAGAWVDTLYLVDPGVEDPDCGDRRLTVTLPGARPPGGRYVLVDGHGQHFSALVEQRDADSNPPFVTLTLRIPGEGLSDGIHFLFHQTGEDHAGSHGAVRADAQRLENEHIRLRFGDGGRIVSVVQSGVAQLDAGSLMPYIVYRGKRLFPGPLTLSVEESGENGVATVRLRGVWNGSAGNTRRPGWIDYRYRLVAGLPYLFVSGEVRYPDTYRHQVVQPDKPMLSRKIDAGWEAVAPVELRFAARTHAADPFVIHKRNFLGKEDSYAVDYFRHSPKNRTVASINNHITAEYAGVTAAGRGMAVAMNTQVNANFAFCPFTMQYDPDDKRFAIRANPFGTYHGAQALPPTRGNRQGYEAVLLSAPQLKSAGPTYNGYHDRFDLMVAFFGGDAIPEKVKGDLVAFARRPVVIGKKAAPGRSETSDPVVLPPAGFMAMPYKNGVVFHWEGAGDDETRFTIRYRGTLDPVDHSFTVTGANSHFVHGSHFSSTGPFTATVQRVTPHGHHSAESPPIRFELTPKVHDVIAIPKDFMARVLWTNVSAWMRRNIL